MEAFKEYITNLSVKEGIKIKQITNVNGFLKIDLEDEEVEKQIGKLHEKDDETIRSFLENNKTVCMILILSMIDMIPILSTVFSLIDDPNEFDGLFEQFGLIDVCIPPIKAGAFCYHDDTKPIDMNTTEMESFNNIANTMTNDDTCFITELSSNTGVPIISISQIYLACDKDKSKTVEMLKESIGFAEEVQPFLRTNKKIVEIDGEQYSTVKTSEFTQQYIKNGIILYKKPTNDSQQKSHNSNIVGFGDM